ncbi:MAG: hypothetical protein AAFX87_11405 [Bacteroidota bacterium]
MRSIITISLWTVVILIGCTNQDPHDRKSKKDSGIGDSTGERETITVNVKVKNLIDSLMADGYILEKCEDCRPPGLIGNTVTGITKFNDEGIYFEHNVEISGYSFVGYQLSKPTKMSFRDVRRIYLWSFINAEEEDKFRKQLPYYNRALAKYKEMSEVKYVNGNCIQTQEII